MSCLSFNKLFPARKTWKKLRLKIQSKLHKSKVIHKLPKSIISKKKSKKKKKLFSWNILQRNKFKPNKQQPSSKTLPTTTLHHKYHKRADPVYIDQLFIQPAVVSTANVKPHCLSTVVSSFMVQPLLLANNIESNKDMMPCSSSTSSRPKKLVGGCSDDNNNNIVGKNTNIHSMDDMWESLDMPPHMDGIGINERAEEFIASFRAEMQLQEIIARRL